MSLIVIFGIYFFINCVLVYFAFKPTPIDAQHVRTHYNKYKVDMIIATFIALPIFIFTLIKK